MPNNFGFIERSSLHGTSISGIEIISQGGKTTITFTEENKKITAEFKIYHLEDLEKTAEFKELSEVAFSEKFINTWFTKNGTGIIIKYSNTNEMAFIFKCQTNNYSNNIDFYFNQLCAAHFYPMNYFRELDFAIFINTTSHLSIQELREIPGMHEKKILFLSQHLYQLKKLVEKNINFQQIGLLDDRRLKLFLDNDALIGTLLESGITFQQILEMNVNLLRKLIHTYHLKDVLRFITMQQILGIDTVLPPIPKKEDIILSNNNATANLPWGRTGNFSFHNEDPGVQIIYNGENETSSFEVIYTVVKNANALELNGTLVNLRSEKLINTWFIGSHFNDHDQKITAFYNPNQKIILQETCDRNFPEYRLKRDYLRLLLTIPYYIEKKFCNYLENAGYPIDSLRELPSMTSAKLDILSRHLHAFKKLLQTGLKIPDFAKVDEERLLYVLNNYDKAKTAFDFVSPAVVLGLEDKSLAFLPGFFRRSSMELESSSDEEVNLSKSEEVKKSSRCSIM